jgi:hypothetical protein
MRLASLALGRRSINLRLSNGQVHYPRNRCSLHGLVDYSRFNHLVMSEMY